MTKLIFATMAAALALSACQGERHQDAVEDHSLDGPAEAAGETQDGDTAENAAEMQDQTGDSEAENASPDPQTNAGEEQAAALVTPEGSQEATPISAAPVANAAASADATAGGRVYGATCVACHGPDGTGTLPGVPDFTTANGRLAKSDAVLLRNMINGFQTPGSPMAMPPKGGNASLSDQDMANVLAYMRRAFGR